MKSSRDAPLPRQRMGRRRRSQARGRGSGSTAAVATASMFLSLSTTATCTSALISSPTGFVSSRSAHHHRGGRIGACRTRSGSSPSSLTSSWPQNKSHLPYMGLHSPLARQRQSRLLATNEDEGLGDRDHEEEGEEEEEEEYNEMRSSLSKIAWLPSVKLGKQPYSQASFGKKSRKESSNGDSYEAVEDASATTPGYQNIEILPVLPMTMVHGIEGTLLESNSAEETLEHSSINPSNDVYSSGVWEEESMLAGNTLGPLFSGTSGYLPHTKGHIFTVAEPRYKKLYDDLLRLGNYYGLKRDSALRRAKDEEKLSGADSLPPQATGAAVDVASLPDPDEKRRFIVTASNPAEDGVFAEYGLLFQLKDLDEVAAVASYEMGGDGMTMEDIQDLVEEVQYDNGGEIVSGQEDAMDFLLATHYEATHDVVGRVKIHRFVNPDCMEGNPDGDEYLMAEATVLDVIENDRVKMMNERKSRRAAVTTSLTSGRNLEEDSKEQMAGGDVSKAVARIKEELRSSVGEAFEQQQIESESIKDKLRAVLDEKVQEIVSSATSSDKPNDGAPANTSTGNKRGPAIPLGPKGMYVERRSDDSLTKPERALRESFAKLVALQHELKEECRFTRVSVQTFGIGPVGVWLSAAAWSQFVEKRLESSHGDMQSDLQAKLVEYLSGRDSFAKYAEDEQEGYDGVEMGETIDFDDLSPELQQEFQLVQARATEELGPLALERAVQMQRLIQTESYNERLDLLRECVDSERRRLEAKKMLLSLTLDRDGIVDRGEGASSASKSREEARSLFERLMSADAGTHSKADQSKNDFEDDAFQ